MVRARWLLLIVLFLLASRPNLAQKEKAAKVEPTDEPTAFNPQPKNLLGGNNEVWSVAFTPDGKQLVVGGGYWDRPGFVSIWDLGSRKRLTTLSEPLGVASVAVSPDGKRLAWGSWSKEARLRDLGSGKDIARLAVGSVARVAFSPDGKTVAAAGRDVVCFFDVLTGRERRYLHSTKVKQEMLFRQSVKFSADGSRIALADGEGKIRILAVKDGRRIAEFGTKSDNSIGLAFSPDGQTLLTTSFNDPVYAWEIATGQMVRRLEAATYLYSPDNCLLAGSAGTLKIFDLYRGRFLRECKAEGNAFDHFAFSPNSKWLAASCSDTTISVWPASTAETKAGKPLDEKSLAQVLEKGGASDAYEAIGRMIADPEQALAFLKRRLHAVAKVDAKHVQRLIADLDSDQSKQREAARKELAQLGTRGEPALRATLLSGKVALGSQRRIEKLLHDLEEKQTVLSAEDVLHIRAIQVLERIGTKQARQLLENLSQGAELSPRTRAAVAALRRLKVH